MKMYQDLCRQCKTCIIKIGIMHASVFANVEYHSYMGHVTLKYGGV